MKFIISGGGTGGHIYPALAILDEIKYRDPNADFLYIGRKEGLEKELAERQGYNYDSVRIKGLPRSISIKSISTMTELLKGMWDSYRIIKRFKPDMVIATGGYVSFPITFMAQIMGVKTLVQEANAFPGKANRILAKKADGISIAFEKAGDIFKSDKAFMAGNPIGKKFMEVNRAEARRKLNLSDDEMLLLSFGGSGGQESINDAIINILENQKFDYKHIHITGREYYEEFKNQLKEKNIIDHRNFEFIEYTHDMANLLSASDLVIMSSSAISLAEIEYLKLPSILVPKSYTADNHQEYNARSFEERGISRVILEKDLNGQSLYKAIKEIIYDGELTEMRKSFENFESKNATKIIVDNIYEILE